MKQVIKHFIGIYSFVMVEEFCFHFPSFQFLSVLPLFFPFLSFLPLFFQFLSFLPLFFPFLSFLSLFFLPFFQLLNKIVEINQFQSPIPSLPSLVPPLHYSFQWNK